MDLLMDVKMQLQIETDKYGDANGTKRDEMQTKET